MKLHLVEILVLAFLPIILRTILYLVACRLRSIHISLLNAIVVAGAASLLMFIPLPIPYFIQRPLVIGVAMFLFSRCTEAELFPDVIFIPFVIEMSAPLIIEELLIPLVHQ